MAEPGRGGPRPTDMRVLTRSAIIALVGTFAISGCSSSDSGSPAEGTAPTSTAVVAGIGTGVKVAGRLEGVGGPAPGAPRPWPGTVSWSGPTHGTVPVPADGRFVLSLPPGRYELTGHSPHYGDNAYLCQAAHPLVVRAGATTHLDVLCQMM